MAKQLILRVVERREIDYQQIAAAVLRLVRERAAQGEQVPERDQPQERNDG